MGWGVDAAYLPQMLERIERDAREQLEKSLPSGERSKLPTHVAIETGSPAAMIVAYAESHDIDLIVMGTHGRGAIERMWVGSVTQGVLHRAQCPVVSVREPRR
jgi:nucleotide-binding universal stress UspA family protein